MERPNENITNQEKSMSEAILESRLVADRMKISLVNRIYVTAWLVARNFLFWMIRRNR
jgi:hypothetical protein